MEYVIVKFPESRGVLIDDKLSGQTNQTLMVEEGHHEFNLEGDGYTPESQNELVQNTTAEYPITVEFFQTSYEEEGPT